MQKAPSGRGPLLALFVLFADSAAAELFRMVRWHGGVCCPDCGMNNVTKYCLYQKHLQRYTCGPSGYPTRRWMAVPGRTPRHHATGPARRGPGGALQWVPSPCCGFDAYKIIITAALGHELPYTARIRA